MLLQIGPDGLSKFSSYKNLHFDSLLDEILTDENRLWTLQWEDKLSNGEFMTIYSRNYPAGAFNSTPRNLSDWFRYDEVDSPGLDWELTDSAQTCRSRMSSPRLQIRGRGVDGVLHRGYSADWTGRGKLHVSRVSSLKLDENGHTRSNASA